MNANDSTAQLSFELHTSARLLRRNFDRLAKEHGLSRSRWQMLWHLSREQGLKQAELAERLDVAPISIARQLDTLEQEGLIERRRDASDKRCFRIHLTTRAEPALAQLRELGGEIRSEALAGMSVKEVRQLQTLLSRVRSNLSCEEN